MITNPTVFILGAGASLAYGFPSGSDLASHIAFDIVQNRGIYDTLREFVPNEGFMTQFVHDLRTAGSDSLDAFVNSRRDYLSLAKHAIVLKLSTLETEQRLFEVDRPADWYRYLLNRIIPASPDEFKQNRLKVITYNFDRSFERRLFLALRASFGLTGRAATQLAETIPVIHLHGQLGEPDWLPRRNGEVRRGYTPEVKSEHVPALADHIRIVHEEVTGSPEFQQAITWLKETASVAFLGFGYHPTNLGRLAPNDTLNRPRHGPSVNVYGTTLGFTAEELAPVRRRFHPIKPHLKSWTCLELLRQTELVHG